MREKSEVLMSVTPVKRICGLRRLVQCKESAIVTKDQMKKEGFDNLRDYLNFKQKKTRRKDHVAKSVDKSTGQPEVNFRLQI
jgi:hypothetical protein